jgi:very-short-patch-repair endonuclease
VRLVVAIIMLGRIVRISFGNRLARFKGKASKVSAAKTVPVMNNNDKKWEIIYESMDEEQSTKKRGNSKKKALKSRNHTDQSGTATKVRPLNEFKLDEFDRNQKKIVPTFQELNNILETSILSSATSVNSSLLSWTDIEIILKTLLTEVDALTIIIENKYSSQEIYPATKRQKKVAQFLVALKHLEYSMNKSNFEGDWANYKMIALKFMKAGFTLNKKSMLEPTLLRQFNDTLIAFLLSMQGIEPTTKESNQTLLQLHQTQFSKYLNSIALPNLTPNTLISLLLPLKDDRIPNTSFDLYLRKESLEDLSSTLNSLQSSSGNSKYYLMAKILNCSRSLWSKIPEKEWKGYLDTLAAATLKEDSLVESLILLLDVARASDVKSSAVASQALDQAVNRFSYFGSDCVKKLQKLVKGEKYSLLLRLLERFDKTEDAYKQFCMSLMECLSQDAGLNWKQKLQLYKNTAAIVGRNYPVEMQIINTAPQKIRPCILINLLQFIISNDKFIGEPIYKKINNLSQDNLVPTVNPSKPDYVEPIILLQAIQEAFISMKNMRNSFTIQDTNIVTWFFDLVEPFFRELFQDRKEIYAAYIANHAVFTLVVQTFQLYTEAAGLYMHPLSKDYLPMFLKLIKFQPMNLDHLPSSIGSKVQSGPAYSLLLSLVRVAIHSNPSLVYDDLLEKTQTAKGNTAEELKKTKEAYSGKIRASSIIKCLPPLQSLDPRSFSTLLRIIEHSPSTFKGVLKELAKIKVPQVLNTRLMPLYLSLVTLNSAINLAWRQWFNDPSTQQQLSGGQTVSDVHQWPWTTDGMILLREVVSECSKEGVLTKDENPKLSRGAEPQRVLLLCYQILNKLGHPQLASALGDLVSGMVSKIEFIIKSYGGDYNAILKKGSEESTLAAKSTVGFLTRSPNRPLDKSAKPELKSPGNQRLATAADSDKLNSGQFVSNLQSKVQKALNHLNLAYQVEYEILPGLDVDFYLPDIKTCIEAIGLTHFNPDGTLTIQTIVRKDILEAKGYRVVLVSNADMAADTPQQAERIAKILRNEDEQKLDVSIDDLLGSQMPIGSANDGQGSKIMKPETEQPLSIKSSEKAIVGRLEPIPSSVIEKIRKKNLKQHNELDEDLEIIVTPSDEDQGEPEKEDK